MSKDLKKRGWSFVGPTTCMNASPKTGSALSLNHCNYSAAGPLD